MSFSFSDNPSTKHPARHLPIGTQYPLIINADAVKTCKVAAQGFKPIRRRGSQVIQEVRAVQHIQFS